MPTSKSNHNDSINLKNPKLINCNNPNCKASYFEIMPNCPFCEGRTSNYFTPSLIKNSPLSHTTTILNGLRISKLHNVFRKWAPISILVIFIFFIILFYYGYLNYKIHTQPYTPPSITTNNTNKHIPTIMPNGKIYNCSNLNIHSLTNEEICFHYNSNKFPACNPILTNQLRLRNAIVAPADKCGQIALSVL
jgi:hypothetical protein